jgi:hypothetical protein
MHLIMGDSPAQNRYGVVFSEPHSVALADMDGDGLKDIVTGKTYYSHHKQSPMWDAGAVVYWFRLARTDKGVDWVPYKIDGEAGIGRQVSIVDVNNDRLPDVVVGGMVGAHVLIHKKEVVTEQQFKDAQPKPVTTIETKPLRGPKSVIDEATGKVAGALEGEDLKVLSVSAGKTTVQGMSGFKADRWSGDKQLFWTGAKPGAKLELELTVPADGEYELTAVFTTARDYAIVNTTLDGVGLGGPFDLYSADVVTSGVQTLGTRTLKAGPHTLALEIAGSNPAAVKAYMVGLDCVRLKLTGRD